MRSMNNPVNRLVISGWIAICATILIIGNLWIVVEDGFKVEGFIFGTIVAAFAFLLIPWRFEFLLRPYKIDVNHSGVVLYQRYFRKPIFISWSNILKLNVQLIDPRQDGRLMNRDGYLFVNEKRAYTITWDIAKEVREAYKATLGHYPYNSADQSQPQCR